MRVERLHTAVLGAGPSGLAAAYTLANLGSTVGIIERDKTAGGLMRSIKRGEFVVDVGRKELYNRLPKVDAFWGGVLGEQYRVYPHRGGLLFDGHIIDISPEFKGFRRGMPWGMFAGCVADFLSARLVRGAQPARTLEEFYYQKRGKRLTQVVSQGFQEKLIGTQWADIVLPQTLIRGKDPGFVATLKGALARTFSAKQDNSADGRWRHPSKGTGQICDLLEQGTLKNGGRAYYGAKILTLGLSTNAVQTVTAEVGSETMTFEVQNLVSSIPLEALVHLVRGGGPPPTPLRTVPTQDRRKTVVLVYMFLNEEPHFPHAWLNVTCRKTRIGRITNYSGFDGEMVPPGKSCLCCEYYCFGEDPLLAKSDKELVEMTLAQCHEFHLLDRSKCFDTLVLKLPGADASQNRDNWMSKERLALMAELKPYRNLYFVSRTDLDISTLAGLEAAEAIISGNRTVFDQHFDPRNLGIEGEAKSFTFENPLETANLAK